MGGFTIRQGAAVFFLRGTPQKKRARVVKPPILFGFYDPRPINTHRAQSCDQPVGYCVWDDKCRGSKEGSAQEGRASSTLVVT